MILLDNIGFKISAFMVLQKLFFHSKMTIDGTGAVIIHVCILLLVLQPVVCQLSKFKIKFKMNKIVFL